MHEWVLSYTGYQPAHEGLREALCTLGNGYVATRGAAPDCGADAVHYPGTYLAGGYNRLTTTIASRDVENEDLVNLPNWLPLTVRIDDGAWVRLDTVELVAYRQELDLRQGVLRRTVRFRDPLGRVTRWQEQRLVSMAQPHLAGLAVEVTAENWSGRLTVRSALDGSVINHGVPRYRALASRHLETLEVGEPDAETLLLRSRTTQSLLHVVEVARTRLYHQACLIDAERQLDRQTDHIAHELSYPIQQGESITIEKIVALSPRAIRPSRNPASKPRRRCARPAALTTSWRRTPGPGPTCGRRATLKSRRPRPLRQPSNCGSTSSTCCRRCRPTPSSLTSGCPPAAGTVKPTGGISSGTSCLSCRF